VLVAALYPVTGKRFLKWKYGLAEVPEEAKPKTLEQVKKEEELIQKALTGKLTAAKDGGDIPANLKEYEVYVDGEKFTVGVADPNAKSVGKRKKAEKTEHVENIGDVCAPIPGMIVEYKKAVGDEIKRGETVVVLEAMKMFNNLGAPIDGIIKEIKFASGDSVTKGDVLCVIEPKA
jgi:biotin carboxyl carrier protein